MHAAVPALFVVAVLPCLGEPVCSDPVVALQADIEGLLPKLESVLSPPPGTSREEVSRVFGLPTRHVQRPKGRPPFDRYEVLPVATLDVAYRDDVVTRSWISIGPLSNLYSSSKVFFVNNNVGTLYPPAVQKAMLRARATGLLLVLSHLGDAVNAASWNQAQGKRIPNKTPENDK